MKHHLENIKRYLVYIYLLIKNKPFPFAKIFKTVPEEFRFLFNKDVGQVVFEFNNSETIQNPIKTLNNKWGEYKLKKNEKYSQSIFQQDKRYFWYFLTPNKNRGVIGFPELFIGKSPFGGESTTPLLPKRINEIISLYAVYDVSMYIEPKKYNLVFDLWITKSGKSQTSDILHEIMVWEDRNVASPAGKFTKKIKTPFGTYKMYHTWMDRSSEKLGTDGWFFTAFVREDRRRAGGVNFLYFLNVMLFENIISDDLFVSTIEFGNEVYNSCGYTIVNKYTLEIK